MPSLKPDRILGVGGLVTRHDAMVAGEAGADYVLFGEPDAKGERPSADAICERLDWWAELFEPPAWDTRPPSRKQNCLPQRAPISFSPEILSGRIHAEPGLR
jgi:hypothetical protein